MFAGLYWLHGSPGFPQVILLKMLLLPLDPSCFMASLFPQCTLLQNPSSLLRLAFSGVGSVQGVLLLFSFLVWQHLPTALQLGLPSTELWVWFSAACYLSPPGRAAGPSHTTCPAKACSLCSRSVSYLLTHLVVLERNRLLMLLLSFSFGL